MEKVISFLVGDVSSFIAYGIPILCAYSEPNPSNTIVSTESAVSAVANCLFSCNILSYIVRCFYRTLHSCHPILVQFVRQSVLSFYCPLRAVRLQIGKCVANRRPTIQIIIFTFVVPNCERRVNEVRSRRLGLRFERQAILTTLAIITFPAACFVFNLIFQ